MEYSEDNVHGGKKAMTIASKIAPKNRRVSISTMYRFYSGYILDWML